MADTETDGKNTIPMWVDWILKLIPRDDEKQKIWYLAQINMSQYPIQSFLKNWKNHYLYQQNQNHYLSHWNGAISCLRSIYCRIWWTSRTERMSCTCQRIYETISEGENYKRCKRMYKILALAIEKLHFESFLETYENAEVIRSLIIQKNTDN